ncbi:MULTISPECIES: hypothetical protein [unclassified Bradyrhizobium]|uniref:hypothetical protein n=1 Tax=unclassified Bradyrhizobium TaxID=2631580 RepID=UPI003395FBEA
MQRTTETIPLASAESWTLYQHAGRPGTRWRTVKLVRSGAARKHNWWRGWNGERLSNSRDTQHLEQHHPQIAQWVIDSLKAAG